MNDAFVEFSGWIPAIVPPVAASLQLVQMIRTKSAEGVSLPTWALFGIANLGLYVFTEKYTSPQCLIGMLGTATINFTIVATILSLRKKTH